MIFLFCVPKKAELSSALDRFVWYASGIPPTFPSSVSTTAFVRLCNFSLNNDTCISIVLHLSLYVGNCFYNTIWKCTMKAIMVTNFSLHCESPLKKTIRYFPTSFNNIPFFICRIFAFFDFFTPRNNRIQFCFVLFFFFTFRFLINHFNTSNTIYSLL